MPKDKNAEFRRLLRENMDMSIEEKKRIFIEIFTDEVSKDIEQLEDEDFLIDALSEVDIQTLKENRDFFVQMFNDIDISVPEYLERGKEIGNFEDNIVNILFSNCDKHRTFLSEYFPKIAPIINKALAQKFKNEVIKKQSKFKTMTDDERNAGEILLNRAKKLNPLDGDVYGYLAKLEETSKLANITNVRDNYKKAHEITKKQEWKECYEKSLEKVKQYNKELKKEVAKDSKTYNSLLKQADYLISLGEYEDAEDRCYKAFATIKTFKDNNIMNTARNEVNERLAKINTVKEYLGEIENDEIENFDSVNISEKSKRIKQLENYRLSKVKNQKRSNKDIERINISGMRIANLYEHIGQLEEALGMYEDNIEQIKIMDNLIQYDVFRNDMIINNMIEKARILNILSQEDKENKNEYKQEEIEVYTEILKMISIEDRTRGIIINKKINALMDMDDNELALKECDDALSLCEYRNELEMLSKKATILLNMGDKEEALYVYMTMASIDKSNQHIVESISSNPQIFEAFTCFDESEKKAMPGENSIVKDIKTSLIELSDNLLNNPLQRGYINKTIHKINDYVKEGNDKGAMICILQIADVVKNIPEDDEVILKSKRKVMDNLDIAQYKDLLGRLSDNQIKNQILQIINQSNNLLRGQIPIATLCANVFMVLKEQIKDKYKSNEEYEIHKQSYDSTLECIIKDKKEVYYNNLTKLKQDDSKSFIVAPIIAKGHLFSTIIYKTSKGYDCIVVNKGDREKHSEFERYSFLEDSMDRILDIVGVGNRERLPVEKVYDIFSESAYNSEKITTVDTRGQLVGNCFEKEMEQALKFSNAIIFDTYENEQVPNFSKDGQFYLSKVRIAKWPDSTKDMHVKMLGLIKEYVEDENLKKFIDEKNKEYRNNKEFRTGLKNNKDESYEQKKELFIKLFNNQATIDIHKLKDVNFLKDCLKTVNLTTLKQNRDFFAMLLKESKVIIPEFMKKGMEFRDLNDMVEDVFSNGENSRKFLREYFPTIASEVDGMLMEYYDNKSDEINFDIYDKDGNFLQFDNGKIEQAKGLLDKEIELGTYNPWAYLSRAQLEEVADENKDLKLICDYYKKAYEICGEPSMQEGYNKALKELKKEELNRGILNTYENTKAMYEASINNESDISTQDKLMKLKRAIEYNMEVMELAGELGNYEMVEKSYEDALELLADVDDQEIDEYETSIEEVRVDALFEYTTKKMQEASRSGDQDEIQENYDEMLTVLGEIYYDDIDDDEISKYHAALDKRKSLALLECKARIMEKSGITGDYEEFLIDYEEAMDTLEEVYQYGYIDDYEKESYKERIKVLKVEALNKLKDANSPLRNIDLSKDVEQYKKQLIWYEETIKDCKNEKIDESVIINMMEIGADILNVLGQIDEKNIREYKRLELAQYNKILGIIPYSNGYSVINNKIDALVDLGRTEEAIKECEKALKAHIGDSLEILAKKASILEYESQSEQLNIKNISEKLETYVSMYTIDSNNREIRNKIINTHNKLMSNESAMYLEHSIAIEKGIFTLKNRNEQRIILINQLKDIFKNNDSTLSMDDIKYKLENIMSYYVASSGLAKMIADEEQERNIEHNNDKIINCIETIYANLSNIEKYQKQANLAENGEESSKFITNIYDNIDKIDKYNKEIEDVCNHFIGDYYNSIQKITDIAVKISERKEKTPKRYDFVVKDNIKRIDIMSKQIEASIVMGIQQEMVDGFKSLLKLRPNELVLLNGEAIILEQMGNKNEALKVYEDMIKIEPGNMKIKEKIEKLIKEKEAYVLRNKSEFMQNIKEIGQKQDWGNEGIKDIKKSEKVVENKPKKVIKQMEDKVRKVDKGKGIEIN